MERNSLRQGNFVRPGPEFINFLYLCQRLGCCPAGFLACRTGKSAAANREMDGPEQRILAAEQGMAAVHRRASSYVDQGEVCPERNMQYDYGNFRGGRASRIGEGEDRSASWVVGIGPARLRRSAP
jgi:hypothetical protein